MTPAERYDYLTTPVAMLGRAVDQAPAKMYRRWHRSTLWSDAKARSRIAVAATTWSSPLKRARRLATADAPATPTRRVWRSPDHWDQDGYYPTAGSPTKGRPAVVPIDPSWRTSTGEDRVLLVDYIDDPGRGVEMLGLREPFPHEAFLIGWATAVDGDPGQFQAGDLIADALAVRTLANSGPDAAKGYDLRGSGGPMRWGIVTAEEIASGTVGHCIAATGLTRWGQGAGWVPPLGTRLEWTARPTGFPTATVANDARLPQAGQRFAFVMTDAEIEALAYAHGHRGVALTTACTLGRALRDHGFYEAESGRGDPQLQSGGGLDRLGITAANEATFLDWLPFDRLFAVAGWS